METKRDRRSWLRGGTERCRVPPKPQKKPFRLVLLGAPGIGKGTQAEVLCARLGACHLSTGEREDDRPEAIRVRMETYETSTALLAEFYQQRGLLVSIPAGGAPETIFKRTCEALKHVLNADHNPNEGA